MDLCKKRLLTAANYASSSYTDNLFEAILVEDVYTDAQAYIFHDSLEYDLVVSFRGTSSKKDVLIDLNILRTVPAFCKEKGIDVRVHKGFYTQYESIRTKLMQHIETSNPRNILVSSHSLGAALGTLFSLDLKLNKSSIDVECISFGCPRIGCGKFTKLYKKLVSKNTRCVHNNDIVTKIPLPIRFKHVHGKLTLKTVNNKWLPTPISDHDMDCYVDGIKQLNS
jgi:predicted lipase